MTNIDFKSLNPLLLPSLPLEQRKSLPICSAIYFAIDANNIIQYIGIASSLKSRWAAHHKENELIKIGNIRLAWLEVSDKSLLPTIEKALINWFNPPLNGIKQLTSQKNSKKFLLPYYYAYTEDVKKIDIITNIWGDSEKFLITYFIREWLQLHRDYCLNLAKFDAQMREIPFQQWAETIVMEGVKALPLYQHELRDIPENPLKDVALPPNSELIRRGINYITLGTQNLALLKVAIHYDRDNAVGFVSRIVREQFDRNWDKLYLPQVEAESFENWI